MQAFVLSRDLFFVTLFVYTTVLLCSRDKVLINWIFSFHQNAKNELDQYPGILTSHLENRVMFLISHTITIWNVHLAGDAIFYDLYSTFQLNYQNLETCVEQSTWLEFLH